MSNLTSEFLVQAIEKVRSGEEPQNIFSENFLKITGEEVFNSKMVDAIESIWLPIGDKAFIREGYHEAVTKIEEHFYPKPPPKDLPEIDLHDFIF
tara:strand:- start:307 stop:591 length:285 start_codon:yes stop_codon:yes gene_type:complete